MMTSTQVVETSVNVISNIPSQDYTYQDDSNLPTYESALSSLGHHIYRLICKNSIKTIVFVFSVSTHVPKSQAGKNVKLHFFFPEIDPQFYPSNVILSFC